LQALIGAILEAGGLSAGHEASEAKALWTAVERESSRTHPPFDRAWFVRLLASCAEAAAQSPRTATADPDLRQDWGEAPDASEFFGRVEELSILRRWVIDDHCRLVAVLGMGGIGKTILVSRLARELAPEFDGVYWRSRRDAPLPRDWLAGAIGFVSEQQLAPPHGDSERLTALLRVPRERRSLLVRDNAEALLEPGVALATGNDIVASGGMACLSFCTAC
jgi:hypothetical protein